MHHAVLFGRACNLYERVYADAAHGFQQVHLADNVVLEGTRGSIPRGGYVALGGKMKDAVGANRGYQFVCAEGVEQVALNEVYLAGLESVIQRGDIGNPGLDQIQFFCQMSQVLHATTPPVSTENLNTGVVGQQVVQ